MNKKFFLPRVKILFKSFISLFCKVKYSKKMIRTLLIFLFSSTFLLIFINRDNLSPDNIMTSIQDKFTSLGFGKNFPYDVSEKKINSQNFKTIDRNLAFVSDTDFIFLNSNAKEVSKRKHSFSNPILKLSNNKILVYDAYNKGFDIGTISNSYLKKFLKDDILTGNIAPNGTYAFVTKPKGSLGKLEVFKNKKEDSFFEYLFSDCYITDLSFNVDGKKCACVGFNSSNGEIVSSLFIFDYKSNVPKLTINFNQSIVFNIQYLNSKNIAVIGDNILSVVDTISGKRNDYLFKNKTLTSYCIKDNKILLSLSSSDDGDNCEILIFNKTGTLENTIKTDLKIKSLSYKFNKIAALSYGITYIYNTKGKIIKSFDCDKDTKKVDFLSSKKLYALSLSRIKKISF